MTNAATAQRYKRRDRAALQKRRDRAALQKRRAHPEQPALRGVLVRLRGQHARGGVELGLVVREHPAGRLDVAARDLFAEVEEALRVVEPDADHARGVRGVTLPAQPEQVPGVLGGAVAGL